MDKITLVISAQTLNTLGLALGELPFKIAKPAYDEIQVQVAEYEKNAAKNQGQSTAPGGDGSGGLAGGHSGVAD